MNVIENLTERNAAFAAAHFDASLKMMPSLKTLIIGCVDPRVDPEKLFGLGQAEVAVLRNVGGRVTPDLVAGIALLRTVAESNGGKLGPGWNLIVLHHTDCGIKRLTGVPGPFSHYLGVPESDLPGLHILDPHQSVVADIARLRAADDVPGSFLVSGLVYDVATGKVETVVAPAPLRQ
jgi:carbonic anhydrase